MAKVHLVQEVELSIMFRLLAAYRVFPPFPVTPAHETTVVAVHIAGPENKSPSDQPTAGSQLW